MDADAEVTRSRLGALNCQVFVAPPKAFTAFFLHLCSCVFLGVSAFDTRSFCLFQRVFRGHVKRVLVRAMRVAIAEGIKRAFAERMS
jgi:hypothetical protein